MSIEKYSKKRLRPEAEAEAESTRLRPDAEAEATVFKEWFLSILLDFLGIREILTMDTAICNKSYRNNWLKCIKNDFGKVSTKVQPYLTNDDLPIKWCSKKKLSFKHLKLNFSSKPCSVTTIGASLLATCCLNLIEFHFDVIILFDQPTGNSPETVKQRNIFKTVGQRCTKLKKLPIYAFSTVDKDLLAIMSCNHELKEIGIYSVRVTDACLLAIAASCRQLHKISFGLSKRFTDQGIITLVSNNPHLEEIRFDDCKLLTDNSLIAIAQNCHKLKKVFLKLLKLVTDQGILALVSNNHDLEEIGFDECKHLSNSSFIAIAQNCHKLKKLTIVDSKLITDKGFVALVSNNHDLEKIDMTDCFMLTDASLISIADNCPTLKTLLYPNLLMTASGIKYVREKCTSLDLCEPSAFMHV